MLLFDVVKKKKSELTLYKYKKIFPEITFKETSITVFKWKTERIPSKEKLAL